MLYITVLCLQSLSIESMLSFLLLMAVFNIFRCKPELKIVIHLDDTGSKMAPTHIEGLYQGKVEERFEIMIIIDMI